MQQELKPNQCQKMVNGTGRFAGHFNKHQCTKPILKDGFCRIHHPDVVKARQIAKEKKQEERYYQSDSQQLLLAKKRIAQLEQKMSELEKELLVTYQYVQNHLT